jgi:hypothetical protein
MRPRRAAMRGCGNAGTPVGKPAGFFILGAHRSHANRTASGSWNMGGDFVAVFLSSLDDVEPAELIAAPVRCADGRNNNWGNAPAESRHL